MNPIKIDQTTLEILLEAAGLCDPAYGRGKSFVSLGYIKKCTFDKCENTRLCRMLVNDEFLKEKRK